MSIPINIVPGGKERVDSQLVIKMNGANAFNLKNDFMPYLVFNMKITNIGWGGIKVTVHYNDGNPDGKNINVAENTLLQRSKDFSNQNNAIEEMRCNEWSAYEAGSYGNGWKDGEEYEYRLNLKEAFPNDYDQMSQCWSIKITAWRNKQDKDMKMIFDNFRLESGNGRSVYQTFDGISNADDVALYHNDFSASIENLGYLNSPALKLTGKGNANTQIVFDGGKTVDLLANGNSESAWVAYNGWGTEIPLGKHWFRIDLNAAYNLDDETTKSKLQNIKSIIFDYNYDSWFDGVNYDQTKMNATFIIDSISTLTQEIADGDANRDGTVDILDLVRVKKYAAGIQTEICAAADLDGNLAINAEDLIQLRKILLKK